MTFHRKNICVLACVLVQFTKQLGRDQLSIPPTHTHTHTETLLTHTHTHSNTDTCTHMQLSLSGGRCMLKRCVVWVRCVQLTKRTAVSPMHTHTHTHSQKQHTHTHILSNNTHNRGKSQQMFRIWPLTKKAHFFFYYFSFGALDYCNPSHPNTRTHTQTHTVLTITLQIAAF